MGRRPKWDSSPPRAPKERAPRRQKRFFQLGDRIGDLQLVEELSGDACKGKGRIFRALCRRQREDGVECGNYRTVSARCLSRAGEENRGYTACAACAQRSLRRARLRAGAFLLS